LTFFTSLYLVTLVYWLQAGRSQVRFPVGSIRCFINWILPAALWPWGRLRL